jgi:putative peptidoglycan lipid II flippase
MVCAMGGTVYQGGGYGGGYADENSSTGYPIVPGAAGTVGYEANPTVVLPVIPVADPPTAAPAAPATAPGTAPGTSAGAPTGSAAPSPSAAPGATLAAPDVTGSVARNSATMALGSMVSRVTGFLRTAVLGAAIGAAAVSDDYNLANTLPNMVYELLLGGVLASVIVPLLVRARAIDADHGEAYAQRLLTLATIFLGTATALAVIAAPLLTRVLTNSGTPGADRQLITVLSYLLLPEIFFYGIAALLSAILNTRGHFAAPMWTPILNNIVVIATAAVFMLLPWAGRPHAATLSAAQILVLGVGTTLGIVVQAAGLFPALRKVGFRWRWRWDFGALRLGELARVSTWMLAYVIVSQIGLVIVLKIAKYAGDQAGPGPAIFLNAFLIFMMAHGIVAVSIITALMPRMSRAAAEHRYPDVAAQLSLGIRLSAVILVPATAGYFVLGRALGVTLFEWKEYTHEQALATGWVIAVAGLGLVPFAIGQLQIFAFYALPDTKTPALVNIPVVVLRVLVDVLLWLALPALWVAAGLMGGNAISYVGSVLLGFALLRRRVGLLGMSRVASTLVRLGAAAALAAVPTWLAAYLLGHALGDGKLGSVIQLTVGGVVLIAGYLAAAYALRVREVSDLAIMLRGRLGR